MSLNTNLALFYIIIIFIGLIGMVYMHELVHVAIFNNHGIKSEITWHITYAETSPINKIDWKYCDEYCLLAHHINEAITYPMMAFYTVVTLGIYFMLLKQNETIIIKQKKKR